jgi:Ran GTPase-activating protein (RanGAP) involved in mRNA processing and transport
LKLGLQAIAGALLDLMQLFAALKDNTSVTSIDLSDNVITDEGMSFLTGVLAVGMAPNLIHINLRGNPISSKGRELLAGLYHLRNQLLVRQTRIAIKSLEIIICMSYPSFLFSSVLSLVFGIKFHLEELILREA